MAGLPEGAEVGTPLDENGNPVPKLTKEQAAIIGAYTGHLCGDFGDMAAYCEKILERPIWTHQYPQLSPDIKEAAKPDFLAICYDEEAEDGK